MAGEKRRGLGRGLGALIPQGNTAAAATARPSERPVDVFFPDRGDLGPAETVSRSKGSSDTEDGKAKGKGHPKKGDRGADLDVKERESVTPASKDEADGGATSVDAGPSAVPAPGGSRVSRETRRSVPQVILRAPSDNGDEPGDMDSTEVDEDSAETPTEATVRDELASNGAGSKELSGAQLRSDLDVGDPAEDDPAPTSSTADSKGSDGSVAITAGSDAPVEIEAVKESTDESSMPHASMAAEDDLLQVPGARFAELPVEMIKANARQPRNVFDDDELEELAASIREVGVLQPIVVREDEAGGYELIMGERRWRASQLAGLSAIPAIIRYTDDSDLLRDALLENLHRSQLNPLEEAAAYEQLLNDFACTHEELASRIAKSRPQISNTLRLLRLPPLVQRRVAAGVLSAGHARALLGLSDGAAMERIAQRIVAEGLSVRATEEIVALGGEVERKEIRRSPKPGQRNEALESLASRLSDRFETRVKVSLGKTKGRLTVEFASVQDLNRIIESIAPEDPGVLK